MERIRIGNDIELRWKIYTTDAEGVSSPYDLTGKALEVSLFNAFADGEVPLDFTTQENEITAIYRGKDQKVTGRYSIILRENNGADGMKTVDEHDAFELVCRTMDESRNDDGDVKCYSLSFTSAFSIGGGSIDLSSYAKKEDVDAALEGKQDTIPDLDAIRQGAAKGSTALQSESDPVYLADKPKLALKVEIPDVSGKVDKVTGKGLSSNDYTDADKLKLAGLENYDDTQVRELIAGKANLQHQHTVADITDFPELYYDATAFFTSGAYPSDKYEELLEAVKAKKTVYATIDEEGYVSYVFFMSSANSNGSSYRVLLTTIFADGDYLYMNTFVLQQSGMTTLRENITGKANKATTLAGYGIGDAYTKGEVDDALEGKQEKLVAGDNITIVGNVISSIGGGGGEGGGGSIDLSAYAKKADVESALEGKQDTISDLATIRSGAAKGATALQSETDPIYSADKPSLALKSELNGKQDTISDLESIREGAALGKTALQEHQDISKLATKEEVATKQDKISDLATIREGAAKGATALQSYTEIDPIYIADKPSIAFKRDIPDISGKADKTAIVTETAGNSSYRIAPNRLTRLGTLASNVTLSLNTASEEAGVVNVYDIIFTTPATNAPSITWPEGITWAGGSAPAIAGGKTYEVSIMDGLATYGEFSV